MMGRMLARMPEKKYGLQKKNCLLGPGILEARMLAQSTRMQHPKNGPAPGLSHRPVQGVPLVFTPQGPGPLGRALGALFPPGYGALGGPGPPWALGGPVGPKGIPEGYTTFC